LRRRLEVTTPFPLNRGQTFFRKGPNTSNIVTTPFPLNRGQTLEQGCRQPIRTIVTTPFPLNRGQTLLLWNCCLRYVLSQHLFLLIEVKPSTVWLPLASRRVTTPFPLNRGQTFHRRARRALARVGSQHLFLLIEVKPPCRLEPT